MGENLGYNSAPHSFFKIIPYVSFPFYLFWMINELNGQCHEIVNPVWVKQKNSTWAPIRTAQKLAIAQFCFSAKIFAKVVVVAYPGTW